MRRQGIALFVAGLGAVVIAASLATADAGKKNVRADTMSGYLETPSVSSGATGSFEAEIGESSIAYTLSYSGLEGSVTQAHIHFGQRGVAGGISAWLCGTAAFPGPTGTPACPDSGSVTGSIEAADVVGPSGQGIGPGQFSELVAALRAGRAYANVHSTTFPGGEIRGQINDDNQRDD